ncbi:DegT/DnrJ/EryC1/StrS family aminotransferase [Prochlorothrix hollandica]|uniref:DegT/DnrJ/EryC1/StrS family aminotransferase n=1 Tax=Prochlorothrix hollandica TaxID=1223 RepID=UPI003341905F
MANIPPLDLTQQYQTLGTEVNAAVTALLASGRYIGGAAVDTFEQGFAAYLGVPQVVGCNSGTDALYLALRALDIGPGDEVITSPFTFFATAETISAVGATPVFVDIDANTFNLDLGQIAAAITPRTRALMPVHLFGQPLDLQHLCALAQDHHLAVIEDCAQATGADWAGKKVGCWGDVGCFSFFPTKNLGACGDGGAIATGNADLAQRIRELKEHGSPQRYYHSAIGINSRLDALQATILTIKLRYLDQWNQQRRAVADRYTQALQGLPGLKAPQAPQGGTSVWHQYTVRIQNCGSSRRCDAPNTPPQPCETQAPRCRDWVREHLQAQGISTMIYYPVPLHQQAVYQNLGYQPGQLPQAEQVAREVLSLPMFPELTLDQQHQVITALKDCLLP